MTDVLVRLTTPSSGALASGWVPADEVAAVGHLECRPYAPDADGARLHLEAPDRLLLPASMPPVRLVAGEATLHLAPVAAIDGWCWQIIERTSRGKARYVLVPDSPTVLDYADLVDVDPATLAPTAEPEAAWWAAVEGIGADYTPPDLSGYATTASLATVATTGAYADLTGKPTIPDSPDDISAAPASGQAAVNTLTAGATVTVPATHSMHTLTMTTDTTLVFSNPTAGHALTLKLSGAFTPTFPASVTWAGGSAPTYASGKVYVFATFDAGTSWIGSAL